MGLNKRLNLHKLRQSLIVVLKCNRRLKPHMSHFIKNRIFLLQNKFPQLPVDTRVGFHNFSRFLDHRKTRIEIRGLLILFFKITDTGKHNFCQFAIQFGI